MVVMSSYRVNFIETQDLNSHLLSWNDIKVASGIFRSAVVENICSTFNATLCNTLTFL